MLGIAKNADEAALIVAGPNPTERPPPQLYAAPDPDEDHEARRGMENLALLAVQAQNVLASGNTLYNVTQFVLNQTRDFFVHGVLPKAGLDELDTFLLKKIGMLSHCGFEQDMMIKYNNITAELMCAMRVHLMNETEIHVFCPKEARVFEENCMEVEFMNYTAVSQPNELLVINALRNSIHGLLSNYPTTIYEDLKLMQRYENNDIPTEEVGPVTYNAVKLRYREKEILQSAVEFLADYEAAVNNNTVAYQIELKLEERKQADLREAARQEFLALVQERAKIKPELAFVEVDMGVGKPKANLTLVEGQELKETVLQFCRQHGIKAEFVATLENALRARVKNPPPLKLMLGVIIPLTGDRQILAIPDSPDVNATVETGVFCAKHDPSKDVVNAEWCQRLIQRVESRLQPEFIRRVIQVIPIDAPDSRKLQFVVREGEQHDPLQFVSDFLDYYHMPRDSLMMLANEVNNRLPNVALQIPVGLTSKRSVSIRFSLNDNITAVVEGFVNFYEIEPALKVEIFKRARNGMAPGTFMV